MMTEISEAAKRKACELANAERKHDADWMWCVDEVAWRADASRPTSDGVMLAFARVLQEHSDVAKAAIVAAGKVWGLQEVEVRGILQSLILPEEPEPVKLLADAWIKAKQEHPEGRWAVHALENLTAAGFKIVKDKP